MKETDLMVGDWVMRKNDHPIKVEEILVNDDGYAINGIWDYHELRSWINIDDINPIPLTAEILERNGFRHYEETNEYILLTDDLNCVVLTLNGLIVIFHWNNIPIMCVHELQHALRLCGLNDLADNFKLEE